MLGEIDNLPAALQKLTHEVADQAAEPLNKSLKLGKVKLKPVKVGYVFIK